MSFGRASFALISIAAAALQPVSIAQSVISTHSGLINFFEGAVYLGDQALEPHVGRFPSIPEGGELRTVEGRAEVLLTPGVFLRMGEHSDIRLVGSSLRDTQVALENGSILVESGIPNLKTSVTLIYKEWRVRLLEKGAYRMDSEPPRLLVREGRAEVLTGEGVQPVTVEHGMNLPFAGVLVPETYAEPANDSLSEWSAGRGDSISADNAITGQLDEDPADRPPGAGNFTYYPLLGLGALGVSSVGPYSAYLPTQPGFNSIYLPGYTYRPPMFGIVGVAPNGRRLPGYPLSVPLFVPRTGIPVGVGVPSLGAVPRPGYPRPLMPGVTSRPIGSSPMSPGPTMGRPAAVHVPAPIGAHR